MSRNLIEKSTSISAELASQAFEMSKSDTRDASFHLVREAPTQSLTQIERYAQSRSCDTFACRSVLVTLVEVVF